MAATLASSLVPTTLAGHPFWQETDPAVRSAQRVQFLKNASILGGLILAANDTDGKPSVSWRAHRALEHGIHQVVARFAFSENRVAGLEGADVGFVVENSKGVHAMPLRTPGLERQTAAPALPTIVDPSSWAELFRRAGARFVMPVAEHHDGFAMYDCPFSRWTAAKMGPQRDLLRDLAPEVRARGMIFGVSSHRAEHWFFMNGGREFESDVIGAAPVRQV